jgi:SAM-dependent methyltransferase
MAGTIENIQFMNTEEIRERVREQYSAAAKQAAAGSGCCSGGNIDTTSAGFYSEEEAAQIPLEACLASLGCGNPTALARLNPGETVLDLGSGGGIDVLLSARRVGPTGFAYGLDMTDEMLDLAEQNRRKAGVENVRFLKGYIEKVPLPDGSVDVIISNCVINLAADKRPVLKEAFRVLKPGGRFAVSDVIRQGDAPDEVLQSVEFWTSCVAGALHKDVYAQLLKEAGFTDIDFEMTHTYNSADITGEEGCCSCCEPCESKEDAEIFASAFIRAIKSA